MAVGNLVSRSGVTLSLKAYSTIITYTGWIPPTVKFSWVA